MDQLQVSQNIKLAKLDNVRWLQYANELIHGKEVSKKAIPTYRDNCMPCQWLYEHSELLTQVSKNITSSEILYFDVIEEIEILRYELHEKYRHIFKTYFSEVNHSFFALLFGLSHDISEDDHGNAKKDYNDMQILVKELDVKLDALESSFVQLCQLNIA